MTTNISIRNAKYAKIGLQDLCDSIPETEKMIMAELGSYVGDSTKIFAENFSVVYAVDPWQNGYDENDAASYQRDMAIVEKQFDDNIAFKYKNVRKEKIKSEIAVDKFLDFTLDFVYIDALHTYEGVKNDINLWYRKIRPGGYIGGHDYQGKFPGVMKAVDEFTKTRYEDVLYFRDTSWLVKI